MKKPADYHMHTPLCQHAEGEPTEYAARALELGLDEIGFSDHSPTRKDNFDNWRMNASQLDEYVEKVQKARRDHPKLTIRLALEVDYIPGHEEWIKGLAARHPWDYFIGSVHYVSDEWDIDNPQKLAKWAEREVYDVWSAYFRLLRDAAKSGLFEIIGHADLPKKFGHRPIQDCGPMFREFLSAARETDTAIEINTAGLRKDCRELYPAQSLLGMAREMGIALTLGSDAHKPGEVGLSWAEAIASAKAAGYTKLRRFEKRRKHDFALEG